jgi:hypothetical protein
MQKNRKEMAESEAALALILLSRGPVCKQGAAPSPHSTEGGQRNGR